MHVVESVRATPRYTRVSRIPAVILLAGALASTHSANAGVVKVYWTDRDNATLSVTDVGTNLTTVLVPNTGGRLQDVDLDASTGMLYFADWGPVGFPGSEGTISQIPATGGAVSLVCGTGTLGDAVHQLALDPANAQIYFTRAVSYDDHEVSRVNYGPGCTGYTVSFLAGGGGGPGWFPSGLAHDPANDILYWGDIGVIPLPPNGSVNQMTASTLSVGPLPTQLTPHVDGRGRGFALEPVSQRIFLTAHDPVTPAASGAVFTYDIISGTETQIIPAAGSDPNTGYWDIEIDADDQRIWYTAYGAGEIRSAKFDGSDVKVELSGLSNPYGLALELGDPNCGNVSSLLQDILDGTQPSTPPTTPCHPNTFSDAVQVCGDEFLVPPGPAGQQDQCKFCFWAEFAGFENETGIVAADEVVSAPGTPGFRLEALTAPSSQIIFRGLNNGNDEPGFCTTLTLDAGRAYFFWMIQNDNRAAALANPNINVFFSIATANADGFDHFLQFTSAQNPDVPAFALEDLTGGGDKDFTDTVFTVKCNQPPDCSQAAASLATLWPPNHKFVPISITGVTDPDGDAVTITIDSIFQDEAVGFGDAPAVPRGRGSGSTSPDAMGIGTNFASVRAERNGNPKTPGDGRVYHIEFTADDGNGGTCTGTVTVCVPHDQGTPNCVDGGPLFDSTFVDP